MMEKLQQINDLSTRGVGYLMCFEAEKEKLYWISAIDRLDNEVLYWKKINSLHSNKIKYMPLQASILKQIYKMDFDNSANHICKIQSVKRDMLLADFLLKQGFNVIYYAMEKYAECSDYLNNEFYIEEVTEKNNFTTTGPNLSKGTFYFITGLSAAGKTTMGKYLYSRLKSLDRSVIFMDGDLTRSLFQEYDYSRPYRERTSYRDSKLCKWFTDNGADVVLCGISMFHGVRRWNRENIPNYKEIFLDVPMKILEERDPKGLYAKARAGLMQDVVGVDQIAEFPISPDIRFVNDGTLMPQNAFEKIWQLLT